MKKKIVSIRLSLSPDFLAKIDQRAKREKLVRLKFVRKALAKYIREAEEADEAYAKG